MTDLFSPTALLIHLASLLALIGLSMRDQLRLRALLLADLALEAIYYYVHPATPLWASIFWATAIFSVNAVVMLQIWRDRQHGRMTVEQREIFTHLASLSPGEFRRVYALGTRHAEAGPVTLTHLGAVPERLYFIHRGDLTVQKQDRVIHIIPPCFIGEISLLLGGGATATVTMPDGGIWLSWERGALEKLFRQKPDIRGAFERILGRDMAGKVARG